ncbi:MAG TPA: hypothetical protein VHE56_12105 [Mycobacteriales bacterium]|nr:hypothetical protein [Mycobacteriales bacterium]
MSAQGRIRISLAVGELEVEGTSEFVEQYKNDIQRMLERLATRNDFSGPPPNQHAAATNGAAASGGQVPAQFGEVLASISGKASGTDLILVAGWFTQASSPDASFSTTEAASLLVEQGIKLSNPSQSLKNNIAAKKVFKIGSRYKVSRSGEDHLRTILGAL